MDRAERRAQSNDAEGVREARPADDSKVEDHILDDLLPEDFDWRGMVQSYPRAALLATAAGGFFIGWRHGSEILAALRRYADREVSKNIQSFLGEEFGDIETPSGR